jgi:hypothetical protein
LIQAITSQVATKIAGKVRHGRSQAKAKQGREQQALERQEPRHPVVHQLVLVPDHLTEGFDLGLHKLGT